MLVRRSVLLALAGVLAAAGCKDVEQRDPAPVLALAAFDRGQPGVRAATIPLPNDLALRGAPYAGGLSATFFDYIDDGGWPESFAEWAPFPGIAVPVWAQAFDEETGAYAASAAPTAIDTDTITADTAVLVRVTDETPAPIPVAMVQLVRPSDAVAYIILRPVGETGPLTSLPPGRYVFAVRGGPNGVRALFEDVSVPLQADRGIALIAPNRDLSQPENWPPRPPRPEGVTEEEFQAQFEAQMNQLNTLRLGYASPLEWSRVADEATCRAGVPLPLTEPYPGRCWLAGPPAAIMPAFDAVDLAFPHEEIASIQTFEVVADAAVREEVTP
ncbi:MAG TPA: hypothetical protein VEB43_13290 [Anaeromyxobacter sp.]|nr:hypothetical protein [Anaeromyxobacter sp.]